MTLYVNRPVSNATVTVNSIPNVISGPSGMGEENLFSGTIDDGIYKINSPWYVNLNGQLTNEIYISTNSFMSFGTPSASGSAPLSPNANKIFLGTPKDATVLNVYAKNFYSVISGSAGNRTLRMRYNGGFESNPQNLNSSQIPSALLGRASLFAYNFSQGPFVDFGVPWNINFGIKSGSIQNGLRVRSGSYIEFGKRELVNGTFVFTANSNRLLIGTYTGASVGVGTGVWAGVEGTFPNRTYRIRYEGYDSSKIGNPATAWEVTFYENNPDIIDIQTDVTPDYFSLDLNGWSNDFGSSTIFDLTNTSGNYNNKGTRLSQTPPSQNSFEWEATLYENNTNRIDVQFGNRESIIPWYTSTEWTLRTSSGSGVKQLAYGFAGYLASSDGTLLHSTDAISWRTRTAPIVSGYLYVDIVAGNNLYLASAVGTGDNAAQLMSSTDTIHWSVRTMWKETPQLFTYFEVERVDLSYDKFNDRYLIVKTYREIQAPSASQATSTIAVSTNGIQWSLRTDTFSFGNNFASPIVVGKEFGTGGNVVYANYRGFALQMSTNGITWTVRSMPHFLTGLNYLETTGKWYYTRNLSLFQAAPNLYQTSFIDNTFWTQVPLPTDSLVLAQAVRPDASTIISGKTPNNEDLYIMGTATGRAILYSTNAISWSVRTCSTSILITNTPEVSNMTYNPNTYRFAAIGSPTTNVYGILTADMTFDFDIPNGSNSSKFYSYEVDSTNSLLYQFPSVFNAGYSILSTYITPTWATVQSIYAKITPSGLISAWQRIKNLYVKDSGFWKLVHPNATGPVYFFCERGSYENDTYGNRGGTGIAAFQNDTFIVPDGVTSITVELWGGGGSAGAGCNNSYPGDGGGGGYVKASLSVTPGETLTVRVGGGGWQYAANQLQHPDTPAGGPATINVVSRRSDVNLADQSSLGAIAGSGGGYSAIFRGLTPLLVAGGGGGGGSGTYDGLIARGGDGGPGGGLTGGSGVGGSAKVSTGAQLSGGGGGGTQLSGGIGGVSGISPRQGCTLAPSGENGASLQGGRGVNSPPTQGNNLITYGTASNPGTNGGAAGGGSSRTGATVCNDGNGAFSGSPIDSTAYSNSSVVLFWGTGSPASWYDTIPLLPNTLFPSLMCGGGGGGGYYGGGGGGAGYGAYLIDLSSAAPRPMLDSHSCGGGGGGGGSNYVGGAASVISNSRGSGRVPGNTTSPYYITNYLYPPSGDVPGVPFNAFAQGGAGHGGVRGALGSPNNTIRYGTRGENGLVVIYW